jgi:hypothetical protein
MAENDFDKASRLAAKLAPHAFLAWAVRLPVGELGFRGWLDTRSLPFPGDPDRTGDTVARLDDAAAGGQPWAVAVEFQTEPDPLMFGRLLGYLSGLWLSVKPDPERGSRFHVGAVVVNLSGTGLASRDMRWPAAGLGTQLMVVERNLASESADELLGAIERGERSRALLAWLPLMRGADDPGIIDRWKVAAEAEPDDRRRAELGSLAKVFSQVADRWQVWADGLKEWNVKRSIAADEWRAEGREQERIASVLELLEDRFGVVPADLGEAIRSTRDLTVLRDWFRLAGRASDLNDFRTKAGI